MTIDFRDMKLCTALAAAAGLALATLAWADEQAFTNRATELKERALPDARTIASLPENSAVKVLARSGAWTQVEASGQKGWVRVFHLRFPATVETAQSSSGSGLLSGATSLLGFGRDTSKQATLSTTGVRGLTPEDLKNANPDPEALKKMQSYRADKPAAEALAREARLTSNSIDYSAGGSR